MPSERRIECRGTQSQTIDKRITHNQQFWQGNSRKILDTQAARPIQENGYKYDKGKKKLSEPRNEQVGPSSKGKPSNNPNAIATDGKENEDYLPQPEVERMEHYKDWITVFLPQKKVNQSLSNKKDK